MSDDQLYFEDLEIGSKASFGRYEVTREEVLEFARKYDPQPFHLSDEAAAQTHFGRISASGWHTCSMTMAMLVGNMAGRKQAGLGSPAGFQKQAHEYQHHRHTETEGNRKKSIMNVVKRINHHAKRLVDAAIGQCPALPIRDTGTVSDEKTNRIHQIVDCRERFRDAPRVTIHHQVGDALI